VKEKAAADGTDQFGAIASIDPSGTLCADGNSRNKRQCVAQRQVVTADNMGAEDGRMTEGVQAAIEVIRIKPYLLFVYACPCHGARF